MQSRMANVYGISLSSFKLRLSGLCKYLVKHWKGIAPAFVLSILLIYLVGIIYAFILISLFWLYMLYNLCDALLYNPHLPPESRMIVATPNVEHEVVYIHTIDKVRIYSQLIKCKSNDSSLTITVVYLHGNAGNVGHRLENALEMVKRLECNVLMVEYRGYGLSSGTPCESGLYRDALAALRFLYNRIDICHSKIVLFGRSLGGAVAIGLCDQLYRTYRSIPHYPSPMALIIENTFTSLPRISSHLCLKQRSAFSRFISMVPDWFYKSRFDSLAKIANVTLPTLFICGLSDEIVPCEMMTQLFNASLSQHKELHKFEGGSHNFTWKLHGYYDVIDSFLSKVTPSNAMLKNKANKDISLDMKSHQDSEKAPLIMADHQDEPNEAVPPIVAYHSPPVSDNIKLVLANSHNNVGLIDV